MKYIVRQARGHEVQNLSKHADLAEARQALKQVRQLSLSHGFLHGLVDTSGRYLA